MNQSTPRIIRNKIGLLNLAEELGNVSKACKMMGVSRDMFYRYLCWGELHMMGALAEFERNLIRERTRAGLLAARRRGKKPGRKQKLSSKDLAAAKAMLKDEELTVEDVAKRVGVSPATLYRYFPGGRGAIA